MVVLRLRLLGSFQATVNDAPVSTFRSDKIRALLAYLALNGGRAHSREGLAALLWGEYEQGAARASLRQALSNLRQAAAPLFDLDPAPLFITRTDVRLDTDHPALWVDVVELRRLLGRVEDHAHETLIRCPQCRAWLTEATSLYHGDFLPGLQFDDAPEFDDWRLLTQETLHQQALYALQTLAASWGAAGDLPRQADALRRLLHLLPWEENAHRELMDVLARSGQRAAALVQYERCRQVLADELGVEPAAETTALFRLIQAEESPAAAPRSILPRHNLPPPATPLIGREALLAEVVGELRRPESRLVTLLGPGGAGKTRLALAAARQLIPDFGEGVWFIPLAGVDLAPGKDGRQQLAGTVVDHLSLTPHEPDDPWATLAAYLHQKRALLVLDNLEHLLPAAARFVAEILAAAPQVALLATSQARLRLRNEQVCGVGGLALPEEKLESPEAAAIALFAERAGRTLTGFRLDRGNLAAVADICRLLDGLPLALELTAALVEHFTPEEIAATLRQSLALLGESPAAADLPPRQQGVAAVFDYAWRLLTPQEQELLAHMSLFRGEFSRDAALAVSQGTLAGLAALVDKSLLRVGRPGRYALHALVRHFAVAELRERPALFTAAQERYGRTYASFLQQQAPRFEGAQQREALDAVRQELENVRQAWELAAAAGEIGRLSEMLSPLGAFFANSGRLGVGLELLTATVELLGGRSPAGREGELLAAKLDIWRALFLGEMGQAEAAVPLLLAALPGLAGAEEPLAYAQGQRILGALETRSGQLEQGIARLLEARDAFAAQDEPAELARTLSALGHAWEIQGEYHRAAEALAESLALLRRQGGPQSLAKGLSNYGLLLYRLGDNDGAAAALREAIALDEASRNRSLLGSLLGNLGLIEAAQGGYTEAQALYERALAIQRDEGNRARIAILLNNLGDVANARGEHEAALAYLEDSMAIKEALGNEQSLIFSLVHLGHTLRHLSRQDAAAAAYRRGLALARKLDVKPLQLAAFVGLAELAVEVGERELAARLIGLAAGHPASWQRVRDEAKAVAERYALPLRMQPLPELDELTREALLFGNFEL